MILNFKQFFEGIEWESEYTRERKAKTALLHAYTLLGHKIKEEFAEEDGSYGFVLDNNYFLCVNRGYIKLYDENYDELKCQYAASEYDLESSHKYSLEDDESRKPIFDNKKDAALFLHLLNEYFGQGEGFKERIKVKLKYIFTSDFKIKVRPILNEENFKSIIGKTFKIDYTIYKILSVEVENKDENSSISVKFKPEGKENDIWAVELALNYTCYYNNLGKNKDYEYFYKYPALAKSIELNIKNYPEILLLLKNIKKSF